MPVDYISALNSKGSGLNITQIVDSLVEAETTPEKESLNKKIDNETAAISALGEVASELDGLKTTISSFSNTTKLTTSSTNSTAADLSITTPALASTFESDITISSLATSQTLEFSGFNLPTDNTGSGTITIDFGNWITNGTATDTDSLFSGKTVSANTSFGTPTSHGNLGGFITIATAEGGNQSSTSFTVVGTDMAGNKISEIITGAAGGNTTTGIKAFKTVTSITPGSNVGTGAVTVGHSAASFGLNFAKTSKQLTISSGASLNTISTSLNSVSGVNANIINKGDGTYSLLVRTDTGVNNAIRLTVSEASGDAGLSTFDTTSDNANHQTSAATDASVIVDGVTITRETNDIDDLFDGYSLNLSSTTTSSFRVSSALDKTTALSNLTAFIESINKVRTKLNDFTKSGSETEDKGVLFGNVALNAIKNRINSILTGEIKGFGSSSLYLSELGVRTNVDGTLTINEDTFNSQLDLNSKVFDAIFNSMFSSDSPYLKIENSIGSSNPTPGSYTYKSRTIETTLSSDASYAATQTLNVTDSTGIQIGDFVTGSGIPSKTTVTDISGSTITLSNSFSSSNTSISSGTSISFSTAFLDGIAMTSNTGSDGISFFVSSGTAVDTAGVKITPSQGVNGANVFLGKSLLDQLSEYLSTSLTTSGIVNKAKSDANSRLSDFNDDLLLVDDKVASLTKRYKTQFSAMEQIVTSLKSTGDYLENMMTSWNKEN